MRTWLLAAILSCKGGGAAPPITLTIDPQDAEVDPGHTVVFKATWNGTAHDPAWALNGPGSIAPSTGKETTYTPPVASASATATLTVTVSSGAKTATQTAAIAIHPAPAASAVPAQSAPKARSRWPKAKHGSFSAEDLAQLPDDGARRAAKQLIEAVMANDPEGFLALVPAELKLRKIKVTRADVEARIDHSGVQALTVAQRGEAAQAFDPSTGQPVEWSRWHTTPPNKGTFGVYFGSGYGNTLVASFSKQADGAWNVVEIAVDDFGEP